MIEEADHIDHEVGSESHIVEAIVGPHLIVALAAFPEVGVKARGEDGSPVGTAVGRDGGSEDVAKAPAAGVAVGDHLRTTLHAYKAVGIGMRQLLSTGLRGEAEEKGQRGNDE